jgi:hypothetical protein
MTAACCGHHGNGMLRGEAHSHETDQPGRDTVQSGVAVCHIGFVLRRISPAVAPAPHVYYALVTIHSIRNAAGTVFDVLQRNAYLGWITLLALLTVSCESRLVIPRACRYRASTASEAQFLQARPLPIIRPRRFHPPMKEDLGRSSTDLYTQTCGTAQEGLKLGDGWPAMGRNASIPIQKVACDPVYQKKG